ncbi:MAG: hypothetical protein JXA11_07945 [Phycisphaerae bacterium]|nr:hypothetical protein [Phycisphaerae bacterium]
MTPMDTSHSSIPRIQDENNTRAAGDEQLAHVSRMNLENRNKWNEIINQLSNWWKNPLQLIWDNDFTPPSRDVIDFAFREAVQWRDKNCGAFDRVAPDGEGGITFEAYRGSQHESLTINADLTREFLRFENCRLVESFLF